MISVSVSSLLHSPQGAHQPPFTAVKANTSLASSPNRVIFKREKGKENNIEVLGFKKSSHF